MLPWAQCRRLRKSYRHGIRRLLLLTLHELVELAGGPLLATETKGDRQRQRRTTHQDVIGKTDNFAAHLHLIERKQNYEHRDGIVRHPSDEHGVLHTDVLAVGHDGVAHETGEVQTDGENQHRHNHVWHEQCDLTEEVGNHREAEGIERRQQRYQDYQPVGQQPKNIDGRLAHPALTQEAVEPGLLGDDIEINQFETADDDDREQLGHQPTDQQDQDDADQPRHEFTQLQQKSSHRLHHQIDLVHSAPPVIGENFLTTRTSCAPPRRESTRSYLF